MTEKPLDRLEEEHEQPNAEPESEAAEGAPIPDDEAAEGASAPSPRAGDPVVTLLLTGALALIAVLLATGALMFIYLNTLNDAPRTSVERDLATWEVAVKECPDDVNAWANLAYAYAEAGRTDDALDTVAKAKRVTGRQQFVIVEADVLRLAGRHTEAVKTYDLAEKAVRQIEQEVQAERRKVGVKVEADQDALARVYFGRALSEREIGDDAAAVKDLEKAVKLQPQSATMWVALGDLYAGSKETSRAEQAYRMALTYVPDDPGALSGLEKLSGGEGR